MGWTLTISATNLGTVFLNTSKSSGYEGRRLAGKEFSGVFETEDGEIITLVDMQDQIEPYLEKHRTDSRRSIKRTFERIRNFWI
jgi:hypothetical protein